VLKHEFTPVENYFFLLPLEEPGDAGLIRLFPPDEDERPTEWYPSFLLLYEVEEMLSKSTNVLEKVARNLECHYAVNDYDQLEFIFHLADAGRSDNSELLGGLTINVDEMPVGKMLCSAWSLALSPMADSSEAALSSLVFLHESHSPIRQLKG
jgi:hypothetical protein